MKKLPFILILSSFIISCSEQTQISTGNTHRDYMINSSDSVKIFVRELQDPVNDTLFPYPLLLIHGGNHMEAYDDIKSVVDFIKEKDNKDKTSLFGWATGGHWGGYFASRNSSDLAHFISLNSLYGIDAPWELKQFFWQVGDTTKFKRSGLFRTSNRSGL